MVSPLLAKVQHLLSGEEKIYHQRTLAGGDGDARKSPAWFYIDIQAKGSVFAVCLTKAFDPNRRAGCCIELLHHTLRIRLTVIR
jgi:hypothetical protein